MKGILKIAFYSCQKAVDLIEAKQQNGLNKSEAIRLKIHLGMCKKCNAWNAQSEQMSDSLNRYFKQFSSDEQNADNSELKRTIQEKLKNK